MVSVSSDYIAEDFMDVNERCQKLPLVKTHRNPWGGGLQEDGTLQFPFPIYSKSVHDWIKALYDLDLTDRDYYDHFEKIKEKHVEELTRDEILTRMTYLVRAERFCDGVIEEALNDGTLEALSVRLHEITKPGGSI